MLYFILGHMVPFKAARLPWWLCRMKLPKNAQQLSLADMEKSSEEEEAKGRIFTDERSFTNPNLRNTLKNKKGIQRTKA